MPVGSTVRASRRRKRWALLSGLALLACGVLVVGALLLGLRSARVRQAVIARVSDSVEERVGVELAAEDFRLDLGGARLGVERLILRRSGEAAPFLEVERARLAWSWRALLAGRLRLRELVLERPRLDLAAELPILTGDGAEPDGEGAPAVEVETFRVVDGAAESGTASADLDVLLDSWSLQRIAAEGTYSGGEVRILLQESLLRVDSHRRPSISAELQGGLSIAGGRARIEELRLRGQGIDARAEGAIGPLGSSWPGLEIDLRMELGRLVPDLVDGGSLEASGRVEGADAGSLLVGGRLATRGLPTDLLQPWLETSGLGALDVAGGRLDAVADLSLRADAGDGLTLESLSGEAELEWRRAGETLVRVSLRAREGAPEAAARLDFDAEALPADPGRRSVSGSLRAPGWTEMVRAELESGRFELEIDDLREATRKLGVDRETAARWGLEGRVAAKLEAEGPILAPRVTADAWWQRGQERLVELSAHTRGGLELARGAESVIDFEAALLPSSRGRRQLRGSLTSGGGRAVAGIERIDARLFLEVPDLAGLRTELRELWPAVGDGVEIPAGLVEGDLTAEVAASGPLHAPRLELEARWRPGPGESLELSSEGGARLVAPFVHGPVAVRVDLEGLDLSRLALATPEQELLGGRVSGLGELEGTMEEPQGRLVLEGSSLGHLDRPEVEHLSLEAVVSKGRVEIVALSASLGEALGGGRLEASGGFETTRPVRRGEVALALSGGAGKIGRFTAEARLQGGTVVIDPLTVELASSEGEPQRAELRAEVPLGSLAALPRLGAVLQGLPLESDPGSVKVETSDVPLEPLWSLLPLPAEAPGLQGSLRVSLRLDPASPDEAAGELVVDDLRIVKGTSRLEPMGPFQVNLATRQVTLPPLRWRVTGELEGKELLSEFSTRGEVRLAFAWTAAPSWREAIETLALELTGEVEASVLNPLLAGGVASGSLGLELRLEGAVGSLSGQIVAAGPEAVVFFPRPYATRLTEPELRLTLRRGEILIEAAKVGLNRGEIRINGGARREEGVDLGVALRGVRYRLDYGLTLLIRGDLTLKRRPGGAPVLAGELELERGSVRRNLDLDRELLSALFGPQQLDSAETGPFDGVALDVALTTREGITVRNNLADLRVDWDKAMIRGTVGNPLLIGTLEVDPGGRMTAFGQTVRIDEASATFSGDPDIEPRLVLETTSSLEDPSLSREDRWYADSGWGNQGSWEVGFFGPPEGVATTEALGTSLANFYTEQVGSAVGARLTGFEISYQALPVFGDTDTEARLTLSQRLSPHVTFINSRNPRRAEGTTNLVDLHGFDWAPGVVAQVFNNDEGDPGATLQQSRRLGGGKADEGPRLGEIAVQAPPGISTRRIRRAAGFRRGDPFPAGSDFEIEVDVLEHLRRNGYPGATVRAAATEVEGRRVKVEVLVDPGPGVTVVFEGDAPPRVRQRSIAALYQPERLAEKASFEEMREETERALRAEGFLSPEVDITARPDNGRAGAVSRTVRVSCRGGRRIDPGPPSFVGVEQETAEKLAALFDSRLGRVELAAGRSGADAFLLQALRRLGYPEAKVATREISADGALVTVRLETGARRRIAGVEIVGVSPEERERLEETLPFDPSDSLTGEDLTRAVVAMEDDLRGRGHADARVGLDLEPASDGDRSGVVVRFEVEPGPSYRVGEVELEGLGATREPWLQRIVGLEPGELLTDREVGVARRRLFGTGIFSSVGSSRTVMGAVDEGGGASAMNSRVTFELSERPRYAVSYGARWESGRGLGGALYLSDENFLGRGRTLGLRGVYTGKNSHSLGLYHAWPRVGGSNVLFEAFGEALRKTEFGIITDGVEGWVQTTFPLSEITRSRVYALYQDRAFEEENPDPERPLDDQARNLYLGMQLIRDSTNRNLGERDVRGIFLGLDVSAASTAVASDFDALRVFGQLKTYLSAGRERLHARAEGPLTWAQSVRVGGLDAFGTAIPAADLLRAGGEYSVRGYETNTLGPLDETGDPLGGEIMFVLNEELHVPIWGRLLGVLFFDAGNVWENRAAIEGELFTSAGVGLRSASPIGPLRLDFAVPLDRREGIDPEYKIYLGFGATF